MSSPLASRSLRRPVRRLGRAVASPFDEFRYRAAYSETLPMLALVLLTAALTAAGVAWPLLTPLSALLIPMFLGSVMLGPRSLPWFIVITMLGVTVMVVVQPPHDVRGIARVFVTVFVAFLILIASFRRSRLGIAGPKGEAMLVDLRDRIISQGEIPPLPEEWYARSVLRSAGGTAFAGDFIVATSSRDAERLQVVLVDVSGKGVEAGTRSLQLSGAFGGLLTSLAPPDFLPAANRFLVNQDWDEGFATAIHLCLDLRTGDFELRKAGHPPAVWLHAGSGRWSVLESDGPALGLTPEVEFALVRGQLRHGDGLMLYTDGLVEDPRRDIGSGIDKLAGRGQRLFQTGFDGGERTLIDELERTDDDRALLLVHRRERRTVRPL
ncbi:serine/threonine-protein phosphatase [Nocardioides mangrovicus]|uniref:Serine/threonine-protein phosphatase n=1 Tax=Nocardioides mangrovicus TaxID=2478913 RepID=A0A3L8P3N6_9ACTN|nr:PP2C family protein-serine/threonine phosphatase [Nocardioides mangrovicus]RLV49711.1 serine/threonine-protein phosphatase [Nocardioides mangrovicus]